MHDTKCPYLDQVSLNHTELEEINWHVILVSVKTCHKHMYCRAAKDMHASRCMTVFSGVSRLRLRHNRGKSIAGSPCGDPGLESCKNPAAIRRFGTHPGLIQRWSGKFNSQLKFAGWSADSSPLFLIWRRPVGHRPIIERRSGGHRPKCSGKNPQVMERRSGNRRPMTARCHQGYRTEIRRCL